MITEVFKNIYRSDINLPNSPLRSLNSYIINSGERPLIIDTGFNREECRVEFLQNINDLNIDISKSDVIITHLHADHSGLTGDLYEMGATIYSPKSDGEAIQAMSTEEYFEELYEISLSLGFSENKDFFMSHPAKLYTSKKAFEFKELKDGDIFNVGDYSFKIISVPGHTPDMINLYDEKHKVYLAADHVLDPITPNISFWGEEYPNILNTFFNSLDKIYDLEIDLMLPAHRKLILDHKKRIDELKEHHSERLEEIMNIFLSKDNLTPVEVASLMKWKIKANNWDDFPNPQKWFAAGEAMVHLEYLASTNKLKMEKHKNVYFFSKLS